MISAGSKWMPFGWGCSRRRLHTRLSGRYGLQTINGEPLPSRFLDSEIVAADIQLNDDGTCLITSTERNESGVLTTGSDEGCTWTSGGHGHHRHRLERPAHGLRGRRQVDPQYAGSRLRPGPALGGSTSLPARP